MYVYAVTEFKAEKYNFIIPLQKWLIRPIKRWCEF